MKDRSLSSYFDQSRTLAVSLVLVLPLLLAYEAGLIVLRSRVVNHAGELVRRMVALLGMDTYLALTGGVALAFLLALLAKRAGSARGFHLYWLVIFEAALYGALLGPAATFLQTRAGAMAAPANGLGTAQLALLYVGAGVWEELVFRFVLLGGTMWLAIRVLKGRRGVFTVLALLLSSLAFSVYHHLGPMGEPLVGRVFLFRFLAGLALGFLYLTRGLGICVYTHAFYNVALLLFPMP